MTKCEIVCNIIKYSTGIIFYLIILHREVPILPIRCAVIRETGQYLRNRLSVYHPRSGRYSSSIIKYLQSLIKIKIKLAEIYTLYE